MKKFSKDTRGIQFMIAFEGNPENAIPVTAHVFDKADNYVQSAEINEKGYFTLDINAAQLRSAKLFIAPDKGGKRSRFSTPTVKDMDRRNAYQPALYFDNILDDIVQLKPIPDIYWKWWFICYCRVQGKVVKQETFGGTTHYRPVCGARVHICEVDRWPLIIQYFPNDIIYKIRDEILTRPFPPVPPDPGPLQTKIPLQVDRLNLLRKSTASSLLRNVKAAVTYTEAPYINEDFIKQIKTDSVFTLKESFTANLQLLIPWFCYWKWLWPYFYHCDELAVIETDAQGRFDTEISYFCFGDQPDIYVWVEYLINGVWTTVYNPGRACNTYWNYNCNTEINITLTHPDVRGCGDGRPGEVVEIISIGNAAMLSHIQQRNISQTVQGVSFSSLGLTDTNLAGIPGIQYLNPFGETLNIVADFGSTLPTAAISHYRCSYKKHSDADIPANWTALTASLGRAYKDEIDDGINPPFFQQSAFELKDSVYAELYRIPQDDAMLQAEITAQPGLVDRNWLHEEFVIASIPSTTLDNDYYDVRIELYSVAGGTPTLTSVAKSVFQIPDIANPLLSLPLYSDSDPLPVIKPYPNATYPDFHPGDYLVQDGGNPANAVGFQFIIRVDNNDCTAAIDDIVVHNFDGTDAVSDPDCGFVAYKDPVTSTATFSFTASHPNNFAVFGFNVTRGNGNPVPVANTSGMVIGDSSNGYVLAGGKFSKTIFVNQLLGACSKAAFAETLSVTNLATNGSVLIGQINSGAYDAYAVAAFALELAE
ncbi:hypothetical protein [Foetidibacter luteolus]|uniref:hypothetical protein n=1 Tax=Foetidibacter luteolus TaxID=2608880 RepID=UPI00129B4135|nr:hypothetical protein [Foetidibacter luteolus]